MSYMKWVEEPALQSDVDPATYAGFANRSSVAVVIIDAVFAEGEGKPALSGHQQL